MLTADFDRLGVTPGMRAIDIGAGLGRHTFELYRRGANGTAFDQNADEMREVAERLAAMEAAGEKLPVPAGGGVTGGGREMAYDDATFVLALNREEREHVPEATSAIAVLVRIA